MQASQDKEPLLLHFLKHRRFPLILVMILVVSFSVWAILKISIEVMPKENTPPYLYVYVNAKQSLPPEKQELALTLPLEGAIRTVPNLFSTSTSTNTSGVSLSLNFKPRTDLDLAEISVQEALQELDSQGILNLKNVTISRANPEAAPLIRLAMSSNSASLDKLLKVKEELRILFEAVPEISKVEISGIDPLEVQYPISLHRAEEFGIAGKSLNSLIETQNTRESVGLLTVDADTPSTSVSARLFNTDLSKIEKQSLLPRSTIGLSQLSNSFVVDKSQSEISHKDGKKSIFIEIYNKEGANLFDLKNNLQSVLDSLPKNPFFGDLTFEEVYDKTSDLKDAIHEVIHSLIEALLITFIVVFVFVRHLQQTVLIAAAIPVSLMLTVSFLYFRGLSLNMLTLSGLILGVGMVVDSAVLVVNRIAEFVSRGENRFMAAAKGAQFSVQPLMMSTLTNAAIFLPVAFLEGGDSFTDILRGFQIPLLATLGASLVVSLIFVPLLSPFFNLAELPKKSAAAEKARNFFRMAQKKGVLIAALSLVFIYITWLYAADIQQTDLEQPPEPFSTINVRFVPEMNKDRRREFFLKVEQKILNNKDQLNYRFVVSDFNPHSLFGTMTLYPQRTGDIEEVLKEQNEKIENFLKRLDLHEPGISVSLGWSFESSISGTSAVRDNFKLAGPKMLKLMDLSEGIAAKMRLVSGVDYVKLENELEGDKALVFLPYEGMLLQYGLNLMKISNSLLSQMSTLSISQLNYNGQTVGAKIYLTPDSEKWDFAQIKNLKIPVVGDKSVPLSQLGVFVPQLLSRSISRKEFISKFSLTTFYKPVDGSFDLNSSRSQVQDVFKNYEFPVGYGPPQSDDQKHIVEMQQKSLFIIGLSGLLIYLLLGAMFESVFVPIAIIVTVPLALLFGVAGLKVMGFDLDVMARLSLVILVGIGVNSAIILIDLITELRQQGVRRHDAVVVGCSRRLKAVLMTAGIQILSVLPVALGKSKLMGIPYSSLGLSIISGMIFSTLITLVILPIIYEKLDDVESGLVKRLGFATESKKNQHPAG